MSFLCFTPLIDNYSTTEVSTASECTGFVAISSIDYQSSLPILSYEQANQLIGATALLFSLVFIFRIVLKKLGY